MSTIRVFAVLPFDQLVVDYTESIRRPGRWRGQTFCWLKHFRTHVNAKAALFAIDQYFEDHGIRLPIMISVTITRRIRAYAVRADAGTFWNSISHTGRPLSVGINCALGAELMRPYIEELAGVADVYTSVHPNAGFAESVNPKRATMNRRNIPRTQIKGFAESGFVTSIGRRLLRHPHRLHIKAIAQAVCGYRGRAKFPEIPEETGVSSGLSR